MAYVVPTTRADGYVVDNAEWNKNTVDNPIALRAVLTGGTAGQVLTAVGGGSEAAWGAGGGGESDQTVIAVQVFS